MPRRIVRRPGFFKLFFDALLADLVQLVDSADGRGLDVGADARGVHESR
jgi:hypothetical protein